MICIFNYLGNVVRSFGIFVLILSLLGLISILFSVDVIIYYKIKCWKKQLAWFGAGL